MKNKVIDFAFTTSYGMNCVYTIEGEADKVDLKVQELKSRYVANSIAYISDNELLNGTVAEDRWFADTYDLIKV